ncbi:MAG: LruC domain-containing protein [Bacteroidales bacterium]|nr:LruC domain-containing protein [Bacteroidales bacterium]
MKKIIYFLSIASLFVSCGLSDKYEQQKIAWANLEPFVKKIPPIKDGYITVVIAGQDTIFQGTIPQTYLQPKNSSESIEYVPLAKDEATYGYSSEECSDMLVCFEDTRQGDQDYNDFVVRIYRKTTSNCWYDSFGFQRKAYYNRSSTWYFQPIATGAGTKLKFGLMINGEDHIISDNVHEDFFGVGVGTFVNVQKGEPILQTNNLQSMKKYSLSHDTTLNMDFWYGQYSVPTYISSQELYEFVPFLINEQGEKLYCALNVGMINSDYTQLQSVQGYPLGIATPVNTTFYYPFQQYSSFNYPYEKTDIIEAYSFYNDWIMGNRTSLGQVTDTTKCTKGPQLAPKEFMWQITNEINSEK